MIDAQRVKILNELIDLGNWDKNNDDMGDGFSDW